MPEPVDNNGVKPIDGGAAAPAANPTENVTLGQGQQPTSAGDKDVKKLEEQYNNLQIALRQEREESAKKVKTLEDQLSAALPILDKMKGVFVPPQQQEEKKEYLTAEQLLQILEQKEQEKAQERARQDYRAAIDKEIQDLTTEWNGENGKPKYDDGEVLDWQEKNRKLNLTPKAAFLEYKLNEILDWKIKSTTKTEAPVVTTPGSGGERVPSDPNKITSENVFDAVKAELQAALTQ
jgi:hypothetical protein